jgi:hypothetical protein
MGNTLVRNQGLFLSQNILPQSPLSHLKDSFMSIIIVIGKGNII